MKWLSVFLLAVTSLIMAASCSDSGSTFTSTPAPGGGGNASVEWLIPEDEVLDGGPGKDGIPSIDNPLFVTANNDEGKLDWLDNNDLILGIKIGEEIRGYPHPVLDWHEIINDDFDEMTSVAITYCPLTGTGIGWNRIIEDKKTTFGVSGLLYNSNLMPYDRETDSYWSQMRLDCVHGERIEAAADLYQLVEIPWRLWKEWFPDAKVMAGDVFSNRPYDRYPYGNYRSQSGTLFPVDRSDDDRLHDKERVLGIINNDVALVFPFTSFKEQEVNVVIDEVDGEPIVIFGSGKLNFLTAYYTKLEDGTKVNDFLPVQNQNEVVAQDNNGNQWNIFGEAVAGPLKGQRLVPTNAFIGYWFTWPSFYQNTKIYGF